MRGAIRVALGLLLVAPYLVWLARVPRWAWPDFDAFARVVTRTAGQALLSTIGAAAVGWVLFRGLRALRAENRERGELRLLLLSAVPALFVALALVDLVEPTFDFPFGLGAVVAAHVLLHAGLIAVALARIERARLGHLAEVSWAMGVGESAFWIRGAWPLVRRDVATLLFFVFTLHATSFSLPLLLQGARDVSLEVAIYDLIRRAGRWDQAVAWTALQTLLLGALSLALPKSTELPRARAPRALPYRPAKSLGLLTWAPAVVLAVGLARGLVAARWIAEPIFFEAWITTAVIGAGVGLAHFILSLATAFALPHARFERFLRGYLAPGPAVTAFATLLIWPAANEIARVIAALALIGFAPLYRWQLHAALEGLRAQWTVARTLGASHRRILVEITWPQAAPAILNSCGLAALWACGDFAVTGILLDRAVTLPQLVFERAAHYQWAAANALIGPLALTALLLHVTYRGMIRHVGN